MSAGVDDKPLIPIEHMTAPFEASPAVLRSRLSEASESE
jgi:hypothetical protein